MRKTTAITFTIVLMGLSACSENRPQSATYLFLTEQEKGVDPYRTRMVATDHWLRIDDGEGSRNYLLFDRRKQIIYSVNAGDGRILVMQAGPVETLSPIELKHTIEQDKEEGPAIEGHKTVHYRLFTNGELCFDLFAARGLVPQAQQALIEFQQTLAREQAPTIVITPKEFQTPCGLANTVFAPARHFEHGFPVRWQDMNGRTSQLTDFRVDMAPPELFDLPASFRRVTMEELRGS